MKTILVSILSDYIMPNFLLIKEFEGKYDELLFISTSKMIEQEEKALYMEKALHLPHGTAKVIKTEEDDLLQITEILENSLSLSSENNYLVNITGGTKLMSLAVYSFFAKMPHSEFFYVPAGKNVVKCMNSATTTDLKYRCNLEEYFMLHGLTFECEEKRMFDYSKAASLFNTCKQRNFNIWGVKEIRNAHSAENAKLRSYYSGAWFEEYTYFRIKKELKLDDESIVTGAKIKRKGGKHIHDNEIDIMFVRDNMLYVGECKVGMTGYQSTVKDTAEKYLYKLAAISKDFGLRVNSYLLSLENLNNPKVISAQKKEMLLERCRILGIKGILDCNKFALAEHII